jgi:hypothetical protein
MDLRYASLIAVGLIGLYAWRTEHQGYSQAWLFISVVALTWAAVVWLRNRRRPPGKHFPRKRNR